MTGGLRIGIDVGGTNSDAAVLDPDDAILATAKRPTTADVTGGILDALDAVLAADGVDRDGVEAVMLGTTHCTNALAEREGLHDVGVLRIGAPATQCIPPLMEWPDDLVDATGNHVTVVRGGHEFDGRELVPLDEPAVRDAAASFADAGVDAAAVTAVFSPVRADHEERAATILSEVLDGDVPVSRSHEIGSVGLLDRENATALNAALTGVAHEAAQAFLDAMAARDLDARFYFGQNDGTLMDVEYALQYPIFTVASGPSNSVRGAAALSGVEDGIIVDVGGTTTDVGAVVNGFPRESTTAVEIAEVATNFRMPDLISIGVGGGSIVTADGAVTVGPESVGYELGRRARCFGGDVLTATDVAVAAGDVDIGSTEPAADPATVRAARTTIHDRIAETVDRMKTGPDTVPVVAVGGGSFLVPDDLAGASRVAEPAHHDVANAVGVAIAQVSGDVDRIYSLEERTRDDALTAAREAAIADAVTAGARPDSVTIVDVEEVPLSYLPGNATRVKVKAAGDLDIGTNGG